MITDPIADMLTRIRNAQAVGKPEIIVPFSKIKLALAKTLEISGFINSYKEISDKYSLISIDLIYDNGKPKINGVTRISKPGSRVYIKNKDLHKYLRGFGIYVLSTPKGIMSDKEAKKKNLGGELICSIW